MIKAQKVTFAYPAQEGEEAREVLHGIDLEIKKGEFVALLGHNGSGKSTFAKLLNGILIPTGGKVLIDGMPTDDEDTLFDVRKKAGMVFQNPDNQIVATVVEEDVAFACENMGLPSQEIRRRVDAALEAVGMSEFKIHAPHLLSGGQKQRVAIAGVLAMEPEVIILDEPTAMLDPKGRQEVMSAITKLNREKGMTIVLITHHMDEACQADRVVVMHGGNIVTDDIPGNVFSQVEKMQQLSLGVPQTVELMYELGAGLDLTRFSVEDCAMEIEKYLAKGEDK
ncbi:MAG: energy-coupling factor transporter ATPase [Clostridia bacterium]|nr:energy-coupling factor transporter ATPase [Clostridia bacterium]MBR4954940.1 energy-coupling factor transporter ATPase [Clostridia bacterium]MBR5903215.1 energy-coupling factor transporter ATPase [Clostridia bacterium]